MKDGTGLEQTTWIVPVLFFATKYVHDRRDCVGGRISGKDRIFEPVGTMEFDEMSCLNSSLEYADHNILTFKAF